MNSGGGSGGNSDETAIDLLVFDREEDYASLFLSQLNYSGIVDETFNIKSGTETNTETLKKAKNRSIYRKDQVEQRT